MLRHRATCLGWFVFVLVAGFTAIAAAQTTSTLRIVSYNIEADTNGNTVPLPGLAQVLEAIGGEQSPTGNFQPIDVLALQETTSNTATVDPIVSALNAYYDGLYGVASGAPAAQQPYARSSVQGKESGNSPSTGNGPNALVYNQKTLQLIASVPVDPPGGTSKLGSSSGEYREVMRYEFRPVGGTAANDFYVYDSHYKANSGSGDNPTLRNGEAQIIRNDEAANLPANARVLYVGDYNVENSDEAMYQTLTAASAPSGVNPGQGQAFDVLNPTAAGGINWSVSPGSNPVTAAQLQYRTESSTGLQYRDDFEMMTGNVLNDVAGGLQYISGTYHVFGNNGTTIYDKTINTASNTALNNVLQLGDLNFDHAVTTADVQGLITALSNLSGYQSSKLLSAAGLLDVADINRDGVVDNQDVQALIADLGNKPASLLADLTTASDHLPIVADYTIPVGGSSLSAVPEPSSFLLWALGGTWLIRRGRRSIFSQRR